MLELPSSSSGPDSALYKQDTTARQLIFGRPLLASSLLLLSSSDPLQTQLRQTLATLDQHSIAAVEPKTLLKTYGSALSHALDRITVHDRMVSQLCDTLCVILAQQYRVRVVTKQEEEWCEKVLQRIAEGLVGDGVTDTEEDMTEMVNEKGGLKAGIWLRALLEKFDDLSS